MSFDVSYLRSQFPSLKRYHKGHPVIYLDGPGGTQVPARVVDRVRDYMLHHTSNVGGVFPTSQETDAVLLEAREAFATFFNCSPMDIAFGQNTTSLFFSLAWAISREIQPGDEVLITEIDHEANRGPWALLGEHGAIIKTVAMDKENFSIDYEDFTRKLSPKTKVVAMVHAANAFGTINDIKTLVAQAKAVGAYTIVDAVHSVLHMPIDVQDIGCDFLGCSAYKFYGPHLGVLYAKNSVLDKLKTCTLITQKQEAPYKIEMGTLNHEHIAGAAETVYFFADIGRRHEKLYADKVLNLTGMRRDLMIAHYAMMDYEQTLCRQLMEGLEQIPGLHIWGVPYHMPRTATVSITIDDMHAQDVAQQLADEGIFVSHGHFYALRSVEALGLLEQGGVVRLGLVHFHTKEEVDRIIDVITDIATKRS